MDIKVGDKFTVAGWFRTVANPSRRWWQFWKPRFIVTDELQQYRVIAEFNPPPDTLTR